MRVFFRLIRTFFKIDHELESINGKLDLMLNSTQPNRVGEKDILLDNQEIMQKLHISERTLRRLRELHIIPFTKVSGKFYYRESDVNQIFSADPTNKP